jgi:hypothetical protein
MGEKYKQSDISVMEKNEVILLYFPINMIKLVTPTQVREIK